MSRPSEDTPPDDVRLRMLTKDTQLCMSLAARPSNIGTRFHNFLYQEIGLDFVYKAFTTTDLRAAIGGIRSLGIRGCAISMPFKEECILLVDSVDPSAAVIGSVNTIVNENGHLTAYNTDYLAIAALIAGHGLDPDHSFALLGSGGMAKAVAAALRDAGFHDGVVAARNEATGRAIAEQYGFAWQPEIDRASSILINATPIGMTGSSVADELPATASLIDAADVVFDVVAIPAVTPLIRRAASNGQHTISGSEVITLQALEQFALYTGVRPSAEQIKAASIYSLTLTHTSV